MYISGIGKGDTPLCAPALHSQTMTSVANPLDLATFFTIPINNFKPRKQKGEMMIAIEMKQSRDQRKHVARTQDEAV
ncbi:hypothetical protein [Planktotalea arctica]|uniref:hypothetical protein n=1 Tax=Planktotalea arctica TaxID=1481893 RepID=UPI00321B17AE